MTSRSIWNAQNWHSLSVVLKINSQSVHKYFLTSPSLVLSCPGCFLANSRITSGVLNAWLMAAWMAWNTRGEMTHHHSLQKSLKGGGGWKCEPYQLHPTKFIYKCHVSWHDLLQGIVKFFQLFQSLLLCLLILFIIEVFPGKWNRQLDEIMDATILRKNRPIHIGEKRMFLYLHTCIPPNPPAAASACPAALPCFVSVCQFLIFHGKPSLVFKQETYNLWITRDRNNDQTVFNPSLPQN